jgi:hypothetical protein
MIRLRQSNEHLKEFCDNKLVDQLKEDINRVVNENNCLLKKKQLIDYKINKYKTQCFAIKTKLLLNHKKFLNSNSFQISCNKIKSNEEFLISKHSQNQYFLKLFNEEINGLQIETKLLANHLKTIGFENNSNQSMVKPLINGRVEQNIYVDHNYCKLIVNEKQNNIEIDIKNNIQNKIKTETQTVLNNKLFVCNLCNKCFVSNHGLNVHFGKKHPIYCSV